MSDYISRADAIEAVAQQWLFEASVGNPYVNDDDIGEYRKLAEELFEDVPSADAVEVVRCKDCKYRSEYGECDCNSLHMQMEGDSIGVGFVPEKDFYCAYGERREESEVEE